jgi:thiamine biosynthesis lipoprotein
MIRERNDRQTLLHDCMATTFKLTVVHADPVYARQAAAAALAELDRIEGRLSRYVETSDISRINRLVRGQSTVMQPDTFDCLRIALDVQCDTQGAFDVAYASEKGTGTFCLKGPRPTFGRCPASHKRCPSPFPARFELDAEDHAVRVLADGVRLDLGGIGKGFALDRMAALLGDWDIESGLLAASTSTLLALQAAPGEAGWPIAFGPDHDLHRAKLADRALSGSGAAAKGSHIIDPRTGHPVQNRFRAWAGASTAALADALSTAFMVMSEEEIREYCGRNADVSAFLVKSAEDRVQAIGP